MFRGVGQDVRLPRLPPRVRRRRRRGRRHREGGAPPSVAEGEAVACEVLAPVGHETKPPARYTEASLVKELEERGIGRPSTYASVIETIQAREYVWRKGNALVPSWTAFAVTNLLEYHFGHLVDYRFTATMEEALDVIARGEGEAEKWLHSFYFGNGEPVSANSCPKRTSRIDVREINTVPLGVDDTGHTINVRVGRYGPYVQRGDEERASLPPDLAPDELTVDAGVASSSSSRPGPQSLGADPGLRAAGLRAQRPLRSVRATRRDDEAGPKHKPKRRRCSVRCRRARSRSSRRCSCCRCRASSVSTPKAPRSPRSRAGTGRT